MKIHHAVFSALAGIALLVPDRMAADGLASAYGFLDITSSSHVYALGGNNICIIDDDVTLADQNPALIGPELDKQIAAGYMLYLGSANFAGIRYGMGIGDHSAWALGIRYLNYGSIDGFDETGISTGTFKPSDLVVEASYSRDITDRWRGGANIKLAYSSYEQYSAVALAADLGVNYYDDEHDLSFSAVLKNMGGQIKRFSEAYNRVPFDIQLGYMQALGGSPMYLSITANNLTRWRIPYYEYNQSGEEKVELKSGFFPNLFRHLIFGLEYQPSEKFYLALAYDYKTRTDMSSFNRNFLSGLSAGVGFKVRGFSFGAAYALPCKSGSSLMINLSCSIGELMQ